MYQEHLGISNSWQRLSCISLGLSWKHCCGLAQGTFVSTAPCSMPMVRNEALYLLCSPLSTQGRGPWYPGLHQGLAATWWVQAGREMLPSNSSSHGVAWGGRGTHQQGWQEKGCVPAPPPPGCSMPWASLQSLAGVSSLSLALCSSSVTSQGAGSLASVRHSRWKSVSGRLLVHC